MCRTLALDRVSMLVAALLLITFAPCVWAKGPVLLGEPGLSAAPERASRGDLTGPADKGNSCPEAGSRASLNLIIDDGLLDTNIGYGGSGIDHFMWFNIFTPAPADFPFALISVDIWWDSANVDIGDSHRVVVLTDTDGDGNPVNAVPVYEQAFNIGAVDAFDHIEFQVPILLSGPGDVLIGIAQDTDSSYPAAADGTAFQAGRSWIADWATDCATGPFSTPDPITWPPSCNLLSLDSYGLFYNWMIRGHGIAPPPPWLRPGTTSFTDVCSIGFNGNDGFADPGETITFTVPMTNNGFLDATNVVAALSSTYPITGTAPLGTIPVGSSADAVFLFDIPVSVSCGTLIPLTITVTAAEEPFTWVFQSSIRVGDWTLGATDNILSEAFETWPLTGWTISSTGGIGGWFQGSTGYWSNWVGTGDFVEFDTYVTDYGFGSSTLTSPAFSLAAAGGAYETASLQYKTQFYDYYGTENSTVDITTDGGTTWNNLQTIHDIQFNGWGGPQDIDLSSFIGQSNCQLRFVCNSPSAYTIWEIDDLVVSGKYPDTCFTQACVCVDPGAPVITSVTDADPCALAGLELTFTPGSPSTRHDLYIDGALSQSGITSPLAVYPSDTASHSYVVRAVNMEDACYSDSAPVSAADTSGNPSQPVITAITDIYPLTFGLVITYTPGAPATRHDLYKDGALAVLNFVSGSTYAGLDTATHNYQIVAVNGACLNYSAPVSAADRGSRLQPRPRFPIEPLPLPLL